jgi:hypothetical protein
MCKPKESTLTSKNKTKLWLIFHFVIGQETSFQLNSNCSYFNVNTNMFV